MGAQIGLVVGEETGNDYKLLLRSINYSYVTGRKVTKKDEELS